MELLKFQCLKARAKLCWNLQNQWNAHNNKNKMKRMKPFLQTRKSDFVLPPQILTEAAVDRRRQTTVGYRIAIDRPPGTTAPHTTRPVVPDSGHWQRPPESACWRWWPPLPPSPPLSFRSGRRLAYPLSACASTPAVTPCSAATRCPRLPRPPQPPTASSSWAAAPSHVLHAFPVPGAFASVAAVACRVDYGFIPWPLSFFFSGV